MRFCLWHASQPYNENQNDVQTKFVQQPRYARRLTKHLDSTYARLFNTSPSARLCVRVPRRVDIASHATQRMDTSKSFRQRIIASCWPGSRSIWRWLALRKPFSPCMTRKNRAMPKARRGDLGCHVLQASDHGRYRTNAALAISIWAL